jgi:hypothetical protein
MRALLKNGGGKGLIGYVHQEERKDPCSGDGLCPWFRNERTRVFALGDLTQAADGQGNLSKIVGFAPGPLRRSVVQVIKPGHLLLRDRHDAAAYCVPARAKLGD